MDEKEVMTAPQTDEVQNEKLQEIAAGFGGPISVPTVPVNPIDDELREDV